MWIADLRMDERGAGIQAKMGMRQKRENILPILSKLPIYPTDRRVG
jgi:hypothetical protein